MPIFLIGMLALVLCLYGLRQLGRASPTDVAAGIRTGGGALGLTAALLLLLRGRLTLAAVIGGLSLYFMRGAGLPFKSFFDFIAEQRKASNSSQVQTAFLAMSLDHISGDIDGEVLDGPFFGCKLSELSREECDQLYRQCLSDDPDSARLLETYFDRRFPGWRAARQGDADAGSGAGRRNRQGLGSSEMSEQEAYQTLGLREGATGEEIVRAHRRLMKERHPDHGGTTDDAARINQAKDRLMRRHV